MNRFTHTLALILGIAALMFTACENNEPTPTPDNRERTKVDFETMSEGYWSLTHWGSNALGEGLYCYIYMEEDGSYTMIDNLGSMYEVTTTGTYSLTPVDDRVILTGTYDHGVGDWNDSYEAAIYDYEDLELTSLTTGEVMKFLRMF